MPPEQGEYRINLLPPQEGPRPEDFRDYLVLLARTHLGPRHSAKIDSSGIVQQTLLDGHRQLAQFRGTTRAEMAAWLRRMLEYNIADAFRARGARKRDYTLEQSLETPLGQTCSRLESWLEAIQTSPSGVACRNEQLMRLAAAMSQLPADQREAIELHHLQGLTLAQTAEAMSRTAASVMGLVRRGLQKLRNLLEESTSLDRETPGTSP